MQRDLQRFKNHTYDLLVIGGGINGAAVAHLSAKAGLKVALIDKGDFAGGTSSRSTKLIHGGIRYLENFELDLVRESLRERSIQLKSAPHLVRPLRFIIPVYANDKRPLWMMRVGVWLYDFLSGKYRVGRPDRLSALLLSTLEPNLETRGLKGGVQYYDAQMDDARLCLENVLMADRYGAHVANYVRAAELISANGRTAGVVAEDVETGQRFEIRAKQVVCTAGPWTDEIFRKDVPGAGKKMRLTKGVHIVYRTRLTQHAVLIQSNQDNRIFFVIPFQGHSLIGTTDTDYEGNPDDVRVEEADIDYLLTEAQRVFPSVQLKREEIVTTFAGLRPLVREPGHPSKVSRNHLIERSASGVVYVMGGKYTTYRKIALDCVNTFLNLHVADDFSFTLYGSGPLNETASEVAQRFQLRTESVAHLMAAYGARYVDVLRLVEEDPALKEPLCRCTPAIQAQAVYARRVEMALAPEDILWRRLGLKYRFCPAGDCIRTVERLCGNHRPGG